MINFTPFKLISFTHEFIIIVLRVAFGMFHFDKPNLCCYSKIANTRFQGGERANNKGVCCAMLRYAKAKHTIAPQCTTTHCSGQTREANELTTKGYAML